MTPRSRAPLQRRARGAMRAGLRAPCGPDGSAERQARRLRAARLPVRGRAEQHDAPGRQHRSARQFRLRQPRLEKLRSTTSPPNYADQMQRVRARHALQELTSARALAARPALTEGYGNRASCGIPDPATSAGAEHRLPPVEPQSMHVDNQPTHDAAARQAAPPALR